MIVYDPRLLKAFLMLAVGSYTCPKCKQQVPNDGTMLVNGPFSG